MTTVFQEDYPLGSRNQQGRIDYITLREPTDLTTRKAELLLNRFKLTRWILTLRIMAGCTSPIFQNEEQHYKIDELNYSLF